MKLYYVPGSCALACHIALEWTGSAYQTVRMSSRLTKDPEYLRMNPNAVFPLLEHDGFMLMETAEILRYVAELHPDLELMGDAGASSRGEVLGWLAHLQSEVHPSFQPTLSLSRYVGGVRHEVAVAGKAREQIDQHLAQLDRQMVGRSWLTGRRSIADPYLFVLMRWAERARVPLEGYANLNTFMDLMFAEDAVVAAIASEEGQVTRAGVLVGES